nr:MAG TPA: hypothetical protein [Caudoviricetes sp.]
MFSYPRRGSALAGGGLHHPMSRMFIHDRSRNYG